jgi:hypothetical protein
MQLKSQIIVNLHVIQYDFLLRRTQNEFERN